MRSIAISLAVISEREITSLLSMKDNERYLRKRVESLQENIKQAEVSIIARIELGASTDCGPFCLQVRETTRRYPSWKEHFIGLAGKESADAVIEQTETKFYQNLIIEVA